MCHCVSECVCARVYHCVCVSVCACACVPVYLCVHVYVHGGVGVANTDSRSITEVKQRWARLVLVVTDCR